MQFKIPTLVLGSVIVALLHEYCPVQFRQFPSVKHVIVALLQEYSPLQLKQFSSVKHEIVAPMHEFPPLQVKLFPLGPLMMVEY